ncbi:MAG: hypothetical protein ABIB79_02850 [archaeon]
MGNNEEFKKDICNAVDTLRRILDREGRDSYHNKFEVDKILQSTKRIRCAIDNCRELSLDEDLGVKIMQAKIATHRERNLYLESVPEQFRDSEYLRELETLDDFLKDANQKDRTIKCKRSLSKKEAEKVRQTIVSMNDLLRECGGGEFYSAGQVKLFLRLRGNLENSIGRYEACGDLSTKFVYAEDILESLEQHTGEVPVTLREDLFIPLKGIKKYIQDYKNHKVQSDDIFDTKYSKYR